MKTFKRGWKKRLPILFLALTMVFGVLPSTSWVHADETGGSKNVVIENGGKEQAAVKKEESKVPEENQKLDDTYASSTQAPSGNVPIPSSGNVKAKGSLSKAAVDNSQKKVILVQDTLPWNRDTNAVVLDSLGIPYDRVTTSQFLSVDLSKYAVVVFANDQKFSAYGNYQQFKEYMELFTQSGGVIVFGAADMGWASGTLNSQLPGNVSKESKYAYRNYVADKKHPIVTGELTDKKVLTDDDLYENYCSHSYFVESSLPAGSKVILRDKDNNAPTLVEYPLGYGRVIASGLTWEFNYYYGGQSHPQGGNRGYFASKAMDDLFAYAIRVSSIGVHDVKKLTEYWLEKNKHTILIASSDESKSPIKDAVVTIGGKTYATDENGMVDLTDFWGQKQTVTVTATGFRKAMFTYQIEPREARMFFLDKDVDDGLPYCTMVEETTTEYDLLNQRLYYLEGSTNICNLSVRAEWKGKTASKYVLYQAGQLGGKAGVSITNTTGDFHLMPGISLNPEQPVMIKLKASDGTESKTIQTGICIIQKSEIDNGVQANGNLLDQNSFVLGKPEKGSINDSKVTNVFPKDFELKYGSLPMSVKGENNDEDGTYSVKALIGFGKSDLLNDKAKWDTFKEDFDSAAEAVDRTNRLAGLMQAFDKQLGVGSFSIVENFKPKLKCMGYYEEVYDKRGNIVSRGGGIFIEGGGEYSYTRQFLAGPVPMYINLTGGVSIETSQGLKYGSSGWSYDGKITITPKISLSGGLGIKGVVSAGVEGEADLEIKIQPKSEGSIKLSASIEASLIFAFDYKYEIGSKTFDLWPEKKSLNDILRTMAADSNLKLNDLGYTNKTTNWNSSALSQNSVMSLQDWVLPSTVPQIKKIGNKTVMVFQSTDKSRNQIDSTVLMYSVLQDGKWSEPKMVYKSDSADLFASLESFNNQLYLVWQKQKSVIKATDTNDMLKEALSKTEIYYGKWDDSSNSFTQVSQLTNNNTMDMLPRIAVSGNEISAVWVNSPSNDAFGVASGDYIIMKSIFKKGKWSEPVAVKTTKEFIGELAAEYVGDKLYIAYTSKDTAAGGDDEVYLIRGADTIKLTNNQDEESGIQFVGRELFWQSNGIVNDYDLATSKISIITASKDLISSSFKVLNRNGNPAICWSDGKNLKFSVKTENSWSNAISLKEGGLNTIQNMDVLLQNDGSWLATMNTRNKAGMNSIVCLTASEKADVSLDYALADDGKRVNGVQPMYFKVTNRGETPVTSLNIKVSGGGIVYNKVISCNIAPGATYNFSEDVNIGILNKETVVTTEVAATNESDLTNNKATMTLGRTDIEVSVKQYFIGKDIILAVTAKNRTDTPADVTLSILENSENGIVLDMKNIGTLDGSKDFTYLYTINKDNIDFGTQKSKYYYLKVDTNKPDFNKSNNSKYVVIYPDTNIQPSNEVIRELSIVPVVKVTADRKEVTLVLDDAAKATDKLKAKIAPENATYQFMKWTIADTNIATITEDGTVSAVAPGETTATVTTLDGSFTDTVKVKVIESAKIRVTGVKANVDEVKLTLGDVEKNKYQLRAIVTPANATNTSVIWTIADTKIATISDDGLVTAVGVGETTATVITADGEFVDTVKVIVSAAGKNGTSGGSANEATIGGGSGGSTTTGGGNTVKTGDNTPIFPYLLISIASLTVIILVVYRRRLFRR